MLTYTERIGPISIVGVSTTRAVGVEVAKGGNVTLDQRSINETMASFSSAAAASGKLIASVKSSVIARTCRVLPRLCPAGAATGSV